VKLASELQKRSTGRTVYVLDEPTTGLHFEDISKLLKVLSGLVDKGNTVIVIEHNLDVIKTADWVVDMGPEGGAGGGLVVAEGTPEQVAGVPASHTGKFLREILGADRISDAEPVQAPRGTARKTATAARKAAPAKTTAAKTTAARTVTARTTAAAKTAAGKTAAKKSTARARKD
jgi:excinuclease ABC subunit A